MTFNRINYIFSGYSDTGHPSECSELAFIHTAMVMGNLAIVVKTDVPTSYGLAVTKTISRHFQQSALSGASQNSPHPVAK